MCVLPFGIRIITAACPRVPWFVQRCAGNTHQHAGAKCAVRGTEQSIRALMATQSSAAKESTSSSMTALHTLRAHHAWRGGQCALHACMHCDRAPHVCIRPWPAYWSLMEMCTLMRQPAHGRYATQRYATQRNATQRNHTTLCWQLQRPCLAAGRLLGTCTRRWRGYRLVGHGHACMPAWTGLHQQM